MNKEEITYKIPNNQIHISEIKDEDCLIWISPKALYMANTIDKLLQENQKQKEVIDNTIKYINKYESIRAYYEYIDEDGYDEYNCDEDFKKELLDILDEVE